MSNFTRISIYLGNITSMKTRLSALFVFRELYGVGQELCIEAGWGFHDDTQLPSTTQSRTTFTIHRHFRPSYQMKQITCPTRQLIRTPWPAIGSCWESRNKPICTATYYDVISNVALNVAGACSTTRRTSMCRRWNDVSARADLQG